jgi:hypothetical protein
MVFQDAFYMKILTVVRVFAFVLFLFLPSISAMLFAGFVLKSAYWFKLLGVPILIANGIVLFVQPVKSLIALQFAKIAGTRT